VGQTRSFGDVRVMSVFPESGLNVHVAALRFRATSRHSLSPEWIVEYVTDASAQAYYCSRDPMRVTPAGGSMAINIARRKLIAALGGTALVWPLGVRFHTAF